MSDGNSNHSGFSRRDALKVAGGLSVGLLSGCVGDSGGDEWPSDGDELVGVCPVGPGGGYDWYLSNSAPYLEENLPADVDVTIDYRPGAGTLTSHNEVWHEDSDGSVFFLRPGLISAWLQIGRPDQAEFDAREYTNLGHIDMQTYGIFQSTDIDPIENWDDMVEAATTHRWGTTGQGDTYHLNAAMLGLMTDSWEPDEMDFVTYDGIAEFVAAMERGEIELAVNDSATGLAYQDEEIYRPVLQLQHEGEDPDWEDAVNLGEWDVPNWEQPVDAIRQPRIWCAPPDMPDDVAETYEEAFLSVADDSDFQATAAEDERPLIVGNADDAQEVTDNVIESWMEYEDVLLDILG